MGGAIGEILGNAVGVAVSPVPIIAVILMLFSASARLNSLAFLAGWLIGLTAVGLAVIAIGFDSASGDEADSGGVVKVVIGVLLLLLAARQWRTRPRGDEAPEMPGWMSTIDSLTAVRAFGLAIVLSVPNPKNLGLTVAAATTVSGAGLSTGQEVGTILVFVAIASVTIVVPVVAALVAGDRAEPALDSAKEWLVANNNTVMTVLFLVLGAKVLGDGLAVVA